MKEGTKGEKENRVSKEPAYRRWYIVHRGIGSYRRILLSPEGGGWKMDQAIQRTQKARNKVVASAWCLAALH